MSKATYTSITDEVLAARISAATGKIILAAPGLGDNTVDALLERVAVGVTATVLIDANPDVYHLGYGDELDDGEERFHAGIVPTSKARRRAQRRDRGATWTFCG